MRNNFKLSIYFVVFSVIGAGAAYLFFESAGPGKKANGPSHAGKEIVQEQPMVPGEPLRSGPGIAIPSFEGQFLDEVKLTLANLDIRLGKVSWVHSGTVEKGKIIAQRPLSGSVNSRDINFLVSLGAYDVMYRCPSFINMTIEEARALSEKLGITLNEQGEGARVMSQSPEEGEIIRKGDQVDVTLGNRRMWF